MSGQLEQFSADRTPVGDFLRKQLLTYSHDGNVAAATGVYGFEVAGLPDSGGTIKGVYISVNTAPTGATLIVDVNNDGTTIFTTQSNRPTIAISGTAAEQETIENGKIYNGTRLNIDVDQVGSSVAGTDLAVTIIYEPDYPLDA